MLVVAIKNTKTYATVNIPVPGSVWENTLRGNIPQPMRSSPCQDIEAKKKLSGYLSRPPFYHVLGFNCQQFVSAAYNMGMKEPAEGKCCNPDNTVWTR
jgi:hypothetical protein